MNISMPYVLQRVVCFRMICVFVCRNASCPSSSEQQHADERSDAQKAHADGQSDTSALAVFSGLLGGGLAFAGVVQLVGAVGDLGRVSSHRGDVEGGGFDGFGGCCDGRPAGGVGAGGGALGDVAGHVHFEVEACGGGATVEVNLAGADGHGHCLLGVSQYICS